LPARSNWSRGSIDQAGLIFSYLNPVWCYGVERFLKDAADLGIAGLLLTDLPVGTDPAIERAVARVPLDLIRLIAPTTTDPA
jgi:tryptophan synthase alpha chain